MRPDLWLHTCSGGLLAIKTATQQHVPTKVSSIRISELSSAQTDEKPVHRCLHHVSQLVLCSLSSFVEILMCKMFFTMQPATVSISEDITDSEVAWLLVVIGTNLIFIMLFVLLILFTGSLATLLLYMSHSTRVERKEMWPVILFPVTICQIYRQNK